MFYMGRYADDFVVLVDGSRHAEAEKLGLTEFLKTELGMELSMEKARITGLGRLRLPSGYQVARRKRSTRTSTREWASRRRASSYRGAAERPAPRIKV